MTNFFDGVTYVTALLVTSFQTKSQIAAGEIAAAFGGGEGFKIEYINDQHLYPVVGKICRLRLSAEHMTIEYVKSKYDQVRLEIFDVFIDLRCAQFKFENGALRRRSGRFVELDGEKINENEKVNAARFRRACLEHLRGHAQHTWVLFA